MIQYLKAMPAAASFLLLVFTVEYFGYSWWWFAIVPATPVLLYVYLAWVYAQFEADKPRRRPF
jgi:hypothetical protein